MVTYKPVSGSIQFIHVKRATIKQPITVDIRKEPYSNLFINRGQTNFGRTTEFSPPPSICTNHPLAKQGAYVALQPELRTVPAWQNASNNCVSKIGLASRSREVIQGKITACKRPFSPSWHFVDAKFPA